MTPEELVPRAIARDPTAVRALVAALRPTVHARVARGLARSMRVRSHGRNPAQEVEDLVQEVFLALFDDDARALRAFDPARRPLAAFVTVIADHQVASILRSGKRRPWRDEHDGGVEPDALATNANEPEGVVATTELFDRILERLRAELTPKGLELFEMLIVDDRSVEDVGAATGLSRDALYAWRSRLTKLVRRLAAELSGEERPDARSAR